MLRTLLLAAILFVSLGRSLPAANRRTPFNHSDATRVLLAEYFNNAETGAPEVTAYEDEYEDGDESEAYGPPAYEEEDELAPAEADRKSTRLNSSHIQKSRMPSSA